ncbi:MAG: GTPase Era [Verrucomicrobiota bacterium]
MIDNSENSDGLTTAIKPDNTAEHCGMVALVGRANVGKSTLLNKLVDEKVSIVSDVAQTTRNLIRAVLTETRGQLVFLDTPGIHQGKAPLNKIMNQTAKSAVEGVDLVTLVLDGSTPPQDEDATWMRQIARCNDVIPLFLLNKADIPRDHGKDYRQLWDEVLRGGGYSIPQPKWAQVSSLTGQGVEELLEHLFNSVPPGPRLFSEDMLTDFPRRWAISDVIREKLFNVLYQELPHSVEVRVNDIEETAETWKVFADIFVHTHSQKKIVVGYKGRMLRKVKRQALRELHEMFGIEFELDLWVKVQKHWDRNVWLLRELGYVQPKSKRGGSQ